MIIIRMQNKDGQGPYTCSLMWTIEEHIGDQYPSIYSDKILRPLHKQGLIPRGIKFGFKDIETALAWFSNEGERENLRELGFDLYKVRAKEVWHGDKQSVFIPEGDLTSAEIVLNL